MVGTRIRHIRIEEKLPGSGMGEVYRARDEQLDRDVAIKFLPERFARQPSAVSRFIREAKAASALNHPNIVTILDAGTSKGRRFIIMEMVRGRTLRELIGQAVAPEILLPIMTQIARALATAHAAGIVHRDIKPENIMVRDDGYVKVLDFGLAYWERAKSKENTTAATRTLPGSLVGTLRYMSPEQATGQLPTASTDIFSLGIVIYELVTGRHPFEARNELEALQAICNRPILSPRHWIPGIPSTFETLILRMMDRTPELRPTAADLVRILVEIDVRSLCTEVAPAISSRPPLVGRHQEIVKLRALLDSTHRGRGLLALITGEPGIGKTALVEEFLSEQVAAQRSCAVGRGFCSERLAGTEAYLPLLEALEDLVRGKASLAPLLKRVAPSWFVQIMRYSSEEAASALPVSLKAASRELLSRELVAFLDEASFTIPLILFFDDLHWADESTLDLLAYLASRFDSMRILILGNYRPEELQLHNHHLSQIALDLQAHRRCQKIDLGFLSLADVEAYLALEFTQNNFPPFFLKWIHAKTEGNPFFMVELLRYLRDKQAVCEIEGVWTLSGKMPDIERELPQSIVGMVQRKLDFLSDLDRKLLSAASVQGFEFDSPVVARTLSVDLADTEERLEILHRVHGLIQPVGERDLPQGTISVRYRFVHFLYYGALYNAIQPARKASWSGVTAAALVYFYDGHVADIASQVGFLFESARNLFQAALYFSLAAEHAFKVFAFGEAELLARRALRMLETAPRESSPTENRQDLERSLLVTLGNSLLAGKGFGTQEVQNIFTRARQLCMGDSPRLFAPLWGLQTYFGSRLELESANDISVQLLRLAENSEDPSVRGIAHFGAGVSLYLSGDLAAAKTHFEQFREFDDPAIRAAGARRFGLEPGIMLRAFDARVLFWRGCPVQYQREADEVLAMARALAHAPTLAFVIAMAVTTEQWHGNVDRVDALAKDLVALGNEHGMQVWLSEGSVFEGWVQTQRSRDSSIGLEKMRQSLADYAATGTQMFRPIGYAILADAYRSSGRFAEGMQVLSEARATPWGGPDCTIIYTAELVRVEGELLAASGDIKGAEERLTRSLEMARHQQLRPSELRAAIGLSRLWKAQQQGERARKTLTEIYATFSEGFDYADLKIAQAELQSLPPSV
jgi:tRNA A-37 threonylcarbamoyl transferase component Bud32/tetratricopeptide (TPR) repeat protein